MGLSGNVHAWAVTGVRASCLCMQARRVALCMFVVPAASAQIAALPLHSKLNVPS